MRFFSALFYGLIVFAIVSCAAAPPVQEPPSTTETPAPPVETRPVTPVDPSAQAPDQATLNALNAAAARAEAARRLVNDFGGQDLFPTDWRNADSLFTDAQQQRRTSTRAETEASTARYIRAAEAFEAMSEKALAMQYQAIADELYAAREAALKAGAQAMVPDMLLEADNIATSAESKYRAGDYYGAKTAADSALDMYIALKTGLEAYKIREEIAESVLEIAPEVLWQSDSVGLDAIEKWEAGNYADARAGATTALNMYSGLKAAVEAYRTREEIADRADPALLAQADSAGLDAIDKWEAKDYVGARTGADNALLLYLRAGANAERQRAIDLRANTAVRLEFNIADEIFLRANTAFLNQWRQDAVLYYRECMPRFRAVADLALQRRQVADDAIKRASQRLSESDEKARNAEAILQGGIQ